jgi:glycosyltransferase involved in cell wall biosynthesis
VLVEAMFCQARIVATDCPGGSQEVLADGKYGQLVPVGDVQAMADAIEKCLNKEVEPPGMDSWQPYHLDRVMELYIQVFDGMFAAG